MLIKPKTRTAADGLKLRVTAELKRATAESFESVSDHWHAMGGAIKPCDAKSGLNGNHPGNPD